jgi:peroxidase
MRLLLLICSILSIQTLVVLANRNKQVNLKVFDEKDLPFTNQTEAIVDPIIDKQLTDLFTEELKTLLKEKEGKRFEKHLSPIEIDESKVVRRRQTQRIDTDSRVNVNLLSSPAARQIDAQSTLAIKVTQKLAENGAVLKQNNIQAPEPFCPFKTNIFCNQNTRFSSLDGSCNNLQSPWFGKAETPFKRYFTPSYDDAINAPRTRAKSGNQLPNPRVISRTLFNENFQFESSMTNMLGIYGQFLAHDITSASLSSEAGGKSIDCSCNNQNPACMSINMPSNENVMRMSCMRFTRSSAAFASFDCRLGHREQLNLLTSFIDGTQIYGPSEGRARELRSFIGGQLRTSSGVGTTRPFLPQAQDGACRNTDQRVRCFAAGEGRVNENLALTGLQTLFTREHNRVAQELARINPQWDDNRLFQEARKIVIAELQHITYHEWVPTVVGWNTAALFDLVPLSTNTYFTGYSPEVLFLIIDTNTHLK